MDLVLFFPQGEKRDKLTSGEKKGIRSEIFTGRLFKHGLLFFWKAFQTRPLFKQALNQAGAFVRMYTVCWNKPFKSHYARLYEDWMCEDQHSYTKGGNVKPVTKFQLASWVKAAWDQIPTELIKKSFIVCGISNALDNSEDERINVLKPDGILQSSREDVLNKLKKVTEAQGNMNNISNPPTSEEDKDENSENELAVEYDDDFDDEDDVPLSECLV